ncbi:MAG: UDP-N-acetylmuramoyl-L-alanyl-D-glutamate--2,6-diaminopimelate ligase [Clostridia bacterium]|nr:UDP-N-acetylmuramoyl-L-alanyl-D-glutamate--2,6-diaminopimelate ligase [Clostridia bacterium]
MKLSELLKNIDCKIINNEENLDIEWITFKDSDCRQNSIFCCINGKVAKGAKFIKQAKNKGAVAILTSEIIEDEDITQIVVSNVRKAVNEICSVLFDYPYKKLKTIGVVGTNGKTTVCEHTAKILNSVGIKCAKIGTFGAKVGEKIYDTGFTTPDTPMLYSILKDCVDSGYLTVCMELSAHAIYYEKADFKFDILIFTNCTPEHLDFFENYESYRQTKLSAFSDKKCKLAIVNADDVTGKQIICMRRSGTISYGIEDPSDVFAIDLLEKPEGISFIMNLFDSLYDINSCYLGIFNVYNMLAIATTCALCGAKTSKIAQELSTFKGISGRMERVCDKINVFVDYAHTPDGLSNALTALNKVKGESKLICVFGCGGNRDRTKREVMGKISGELADFTVITSDNPRFEDENFIIGEIERGIRLITREYITIRDREQAIEYAVQIANAGDYILIAGKGAEEYQEQMGFYKRFSDKEVACTLVKSKYE